MPSTEAWPRRCRPALGTLVELAAPEEAALEAGFAAIADLEALMSPHCATSDIARLNAGERLRPHPLTRIVLAQALALHAASAGAFDVNLGSGTLHLADEAWLSAGRIDPGGIAKGFALDHALAALRAAGASAALANAGGDLACFGAPHPVTLRDPRAPDRALWHLTLGNAALASSAGRHHPARGTAQEPLAVRHPATGTPPAAVAGASVLAPSGLLADALTKLVLLQGPACLPLLRAHGAEALLVTPGDEVLATPGWPGHAR